jgi:hypothetical protein
MAPNDTLGPPPVTTLMIYAAYGLADQRGRTAASGKPRLLPREDWAPALAALLKGPDGLAALTALAQRGMEAWDVDSSITDCVAPAFATDGFAARMAAALGEPGPGDGDGHARPNSAALPAPAQTPMATPAPEQPKQLALPVMVPPASVPQEQARPPRRRAGKPGV